ncbi:MAG: D-alanyl-D-alanine carboxypeptidase/D-alanyl-D-alanine-endopeptidase [Acidobacteria bacterium]|nr:D-alanyl-D-alanine carboxypeptidase/D-alanyl-D-alanine-endopeptidase [Acidobacteriota bacterium]
MARRRIPHIRKGRRALLSAVLLLLAFSVAETAAQGQELSGSNRRLGEQILSLIKSTAAQQAHWGIEIVSLRDGKELVGWNEDKLFVPASTAKLFVAATALIRLGPDFRYLTTVETTGPIEEAGVLRGDLVLVGRGDPNLSGRMLPYNGRTQRPNSPTKDYEDLAAQIAARGVRTVEGNLVADDSYFVWEPLGAGWEVDDLMWNYGAPVSALAINDNVLFLTVLPGVVGHPAAVSLEPMVSYYELDNRVMTLPRAREIPGGGTTTASRSLSIDRKPGSNVLRLWGQLPEGDPGLGRGLAIEDPPRFAGEFFKQELTRQGVEVKGSVQVRRLPPSEVAELKGAPGARESSGIAVPSSAISSHESLPLAESLKVILKASQNLHAEMLLRTLGRVRRNVGSTEAGLEEVKGLLQKFGIPESEAVLADGSGLSRQSLVTPRAMIALLRRMNQSEYGSLWTGLLPTAGREGSLAERLKGRATAGRIWAKTGSLTGVASLAGYALNQRDEMVAFVLFVNHYNPASIDATNVLDRIAELIARSR